MLFVLATGAVVAVVIAVVIVIVFVIFSLTRPSSATCPTSHARRLVSASRSGRSPVVLVVGSSLKAVERSDWKEGRGSQAVPCTSKAVGIAE